MSEFKPDWGNVDGSESGIPRLFRQPLAPRGSLEEFIKYIHQCPKVEVRSCRGGFFGTLHLVSECASTRRYYLCETVERSGKVTVQEYILPMDEYYIAFEPFTI